MLHVFYGCERKFIDTPIVRSTTVVNLSPYEIYIILHKTVL